MIAGTHYTPQLAAFLGAVRSVALGGDPVYDSQTPMFLPCHKCLILALALTVLSLGLPTRAQAHGDLHEMIEALSQRIEASPNDAALYLRRGELHRLHEDWLAAAADYDRASVLLPDPAAVDFARGQMLSDRGDLKAAAQAFDRFLMKAPDHAEGRAARGRVLLKLGKPLGAASDFSRAIEQSKAAPPEYYIERAQALASTGDIAGAVRGLDEGISTLGPLVTLQLPAIELELKRGETDAALRRVDALTAVAVRREGWLARRGGILEKVGRVAEAREAYAAALATIQGLPAERQLSAATLKLAGEIKTALSRLPAPMNR